MSQTAEPASRTGAFRAFLSQPYLILTLTTLFWGGNVVAGKAGGRPHRPLRADHPALGRRLPGHPALRHRPARGATGRCSAANWWLYLFYGAIGFTTFNVLVYVAAYFTSGVNNALDQVAINIFVMLGNFVLFRTRVRALQLVGVAHHHRRRRASPRPTATSRRILSLDVNFGDALVLLACLAYAAYSIALRWRPATHWMSFLVASFLGAIIGAIVYPGNARRRLRRLRRAIPAITPLGWLIVALHDPLPLAGLADPLRPRRRADRRQPRQPLHQPDPALGRDRLGADPRRSGCEPFHFVAAA